MNSVALLRGGGKENEQGEARSVFTPTLTLSSLSAEILKTFLDEFFKMRMEPGSGGAN